MLGKLSQVGMIILAGVPVVAFLAPLDGLGPGTFWRCSLLLAAVAFGAGGLAVGASVVSRRGRDAQLTVYILMVLLMHEPAPGLARPAASRPSTCSNGSILISA